MQLLPYLRIPIQVPLTYGMEPRSVIIECLYKLERINTGNNIYEPRWFYECQMEGCHGAGSPSFSRDVTGIPHDVWEHLHYHTAMCSGVTLLAFK